jgi:hypothetical protein
MNAAAERAAERSITWVQPATLLVWGVWLVMLVAALAFVSRYGSNVPSWDDWDMVPTMTGEQPVTAEWLWSQHNEHRVPLPRLVMLAVVRLVGVDFRALMVVNVVLIGAVAAGMIAVTRRLRGRTMPTDIFFPLALLHWGQAANLLWGWQLQFFASVALACVALLAIAQTGAELLPRTTWVVVGLCLLLLPLCGANGLVMVPTLAAWLAYSAWRVAHQRGPDTRTQVLLPAGLAVAALLLGGLYLVGWQSVPWHPKSEGALQTLKTAGKVVTIGLGPATRDAWPTSGAAALLLFAMTSLLLASTWLRELSERARSAGLLLFLGAMASVALAIGMGREGFETRYVTLSVPAWCCSYLAWSIYDRPVVGRAARTLLALAASVALWPNLRFGVSYGEDIRGQLGAFERDMAAGVPKHELVRRYAENLHPHHDIPTEYLPMLRRARVGEYARLVDAPTFREVPVPLEPVRLHQVEWRVPRARVTGQGPWIDFELPAEVHVAGIRLRYRSLDEGEDLPYVGIAWTRGRLAEWPKPPGTASHFRKYSPTGDRANWERGSWTYIRDPATTVTVWVSDTVGQIRITPNLRPGLVEIADLTLLVSAE